jgi:hypothetical protein
VTRIVPAVAVRALSICWGKPARRRGRIAIGFSEALPMTDFNFVLLYVENPAVSADFYAGLLGKPPVEAAPTFVMFALESRLSGTVLAHRRASWLGLIGSALCGLRRVVTSRRCMRFARMRRAKASGLVTVVWVACAKRSNRKAMRATAT